MGRRRAWWMPPTCSTDPFPADGVRRLALTAALLAVGAGAGAPPTVAAQRFWKSSFYPYGYYSGVDGLWGLVHVGRYSPIGFIERAEPSFAAVNLDVGASTGGSYLVILDAQAPAWWEGWRLGLTVSAQRANRLGYYGLGNATPYDADSVTPASPYFYRVSRTTQDLRATVQRRVLGPLRLLAGAGVSHTTFRFLPGATVFHQDALAGTVDSTAFDDATLRAGAVVDLRDNEIDPHRGLIVEGLHTAGHGYARTTASARVYWNPVEKLTIAARAAGENLTGTPPVAPQMVMESSDQAFVAVGGYRSLRGYYDGRFTGRGKLLGGIEARYALLWAPSILEVKVVGFYDVGRVFGPGEAFRVTTDSLHTSGGAELAVRLLRNTIIVVGYGRGSEGGQFLVGATWSY